MTEAIQRYRLFCAATLDVAAADAVERAISAPRASIQGFRWSRRDHWHLTLQFYGDVDVERVPALGDALAAAVSGPAVPVTLRGLGAFPSLRSPRVLLVGVEDPTHGLADLHRRVEAAGAAQGFEREDRRYNPHLTVARAAQGRSPSLARELGSLTEVFVAETLLREVVLFRSEPGPGRSTYTPLRTLMLGPPA